jgi:hypothetical protein
LGYFLIRKKKCSTSGINVEGVVHVLKVDFILPSPACSTKETECITFYHQKERAEKW